VIVHTWVGHQFDLCRRRPLTWSCTQKSCRPHTGDSRCPTLRPRCHTGDTHGRRLTPRSWRAVIWTVLSFRTLC